MNGLFKRVLAFCIDMLLISIVVNSIATSPVNFQYKKYKEFYDNYLDLYVEYSEQLDMEDVDDCSSFENVIKKGKFTYEKYTSQYEEIKELKEKEEITTEEYESRCLSIISDYNDNKMTEEEYIVKMNDYYYQIERNSTFIYILDIVICLLYFVLFQGYTDGQTLGKKLMRIKVVSSDPSHKCNYKMLFIRSIFLFSIIYNLISCISCYIVPVNSFTIFSNILYMLNNILQLIVASTIIFDVRRRGVHDLVAGTCVVELDFKGNIKSDKTKEKVDDNDKNNKKSNLRKIKK